LIEVMVALGIILLLVGILIVGITFVGRSAKQRATKVTLSNLNAMFAELDAKTRLRNQPQAWSWRGEDYIPSSATHRALALNFYTVPFRTDSEPPSGLTSSDGPDALDAPGAVDAQLGGSQRYASNAVLNTQLVMTQLRSLPAIRSQLEQLPQEQQMTLLWQGGKITPAPGPDGVLNTGDDVTAGEDIYYVPGNFVGSDPDGDGVINGYFKCIQTHAASSPPSSGNDWEEETEITGATRSVPVPVDAWNNPIIFVPSGGLAVRLNTDQDDPGTPNPTNNRDLKGQNAVVKSPDGRPFWASAGPDGNFRYGDDNVYSFED
jgi:hypothetical protein